MTERFSKQAFLSSLKEAHDTYYRAQNKLVSERDEVIAKEKAYLLSLLPDLFATCKRGVINGEEHLLLFVFSNSEKTLISPEVYLSKAGEILYEVFDQEKYLSYRPHATFRGRFNLMNLDEFLIHVTLSDILSFFEERPAVLAEYTEELRAKNDARKRFFSSLPKK